MKNSITKIIMAIAVIAQCSQLNAQTANTKTGTSAGASLTTGSYNSFHGYYAGNKTSSGSINTFQGAFSRV
jgi:hypothetical protein